MVQVAPLMRFLPPPLTSSMRHPRETARSTNLDENTIFLQPLRVWGRYFIRFSARHPNENNHI